MTAIPVGFQVLPVPIIQVSLAAVLRCGQSFRWKSFLFADGTEEYCFCLRDRLVRLRQDNTNVFYRSEFPEHQLPEVQLLREAETLNWLKDYFQLEVDLSKLYQEWASRDKVFARFQDRFQGIRILRQDPWENLISFICSSNNNISRITKMVENLCKHFSPPLLSLADPNAAGTSQVYHPFPPPSVLAGPQVGATLRALGFGYRAEYIQKTARMLVDTHGTLLDNKDSLEPAERWLRGLRSLPTLAARAELLKFVGVGPKVADCVLLFSLGKKEVIPVDTHVHQIASKHYGMKLASGKGTMTPKLYEAVNEKLTAVWGDYAGWAHTVLFTADLKSFSSYGLTTAATSQLPTPPVTPASSPVKRKAEETPMTTKRRKRDPSITDVRSHNLSLG